MEIHQWQIKQKSFTFVDDSKAKKFALNYIKDKDCILDIGCGNCDFFDIISRDKMDCKLYGFDILKDSLNICKDKGYNPVGSIKDLKNKFDVITLFECFEHIDYRARFKQVEEINKLLKSNGYVVLSFPNVMSFLSILHYGDNPEHQEPYPSDINIVKFFQGYKIIAKKYFNPWLNPLKIIHCILTGMSFNAIYNNVCFVLRRK